MSTRKAYETALMRCGCGGLRGLGEMHVTIRGSIQPVAMVEVMCVDCVLTKGGMSTDRHDVRSGQVRTSRETE